MRLQDIDHGMAPVHFTRPINLLARCGIALPAGQTTRTGRSACNSSAAPAPTMRCCAWPRPRWPTSRRRSERHPHPAATTMKTSFRHLLCVLALALPGLASAMDYPDKPVRIVVPHPPDGASDTVARLVGQQLAQRFGQSVSAAWCTARAPCAAWRCCGCRRWRGCWTCCCNQAPGPSTSSKPTCGCRAPSRPTTATWVARTAMWCSSAPACRRPGASWLPCPGRRPPTANSSMHACTSTAWMSARRRWRQPRPAS